MPPEHAFRDCDVSVHACLYCFFIAVNYIWVLMQPHAEQHVVCRNERKVWVRIGFKTCNTAHKRRERVAMNSVISSRVQYSRYEQK